MDLPHRRLATTSSSTRGRAAEQLALDHLLARGLLLLSRNFRCRLGELDLVMRDRECIVFVEVRARAASKFGDATQSVGREKQRKLALAARAYISRHREIGNEPMRFDVVAIDDDRVTWVRDAFRPGD